LSSTIFALKEKSGVQPLTQVSCKKGSVHLTITPDSGSEMTAIGLHHLKQLGMNVTHLLPSSPTNLHAANGTVLESIGHFHAELCYFGTVIEADIEVLFDFPNAVLFWYHSRELGILSSHYPKPHSSDLTCCLVSATIKDSSSGT